MRQPAALPGIPEPLEEKSPKRRIQAVAIAKFRQICVDYVDSGLLRGLNFFGNCPSVHIIYRICDKVDRQVRKLPFFVNKGGCQFSGKIAKTGIRHIPK